MKVGDYVRIKEWATIYPLDLKGSPNYGDIARVVEIYSNTLIRVVKEGVGVREVDLFGACGFLFSLNEVEIVNNKRRMFS